MLQRLSVAGLIALAIGLASARPHAAARLSEDGYELWADCRDVPTDFEFLPIYLGTDTPGFVDLGRNETFGPQQFRALQYTRDKDFGQWPVRTGRWYGGMGLQRWPARTVDVARLLEYFRVTAWEIDGTLYPVDPGCVVTAESNELAVGFYNVWVRFAVAGTHTLRIMGKQLAPFPFTDPQMAGSGLDPFGLEGRRIFVKEEKGDVLDGQFVHSYELVVSRD